MEITSSQANIALSEINNEEQLRDLILKLDVHAEGRITVLYSGKTADGIWSTDIIGSMMSSGEDMRVIDKTGVSE
jgi:hypothetical protein